MVVFQVPYRQFALFTVVSLQITDNPKIPVPCLVAIDLFQGSELGAVQQLHESHRDANRPTTGVPVQSHLPGIQAFHEFHRALQVPQILNKAIVTFDIFLSLLDTGSAINPMSWATLLSR